MSEANLIESFNKENLNQIFSNVNQNKWDEAKTIWLLDFLNLKPNKEVSSFNAMSDSFNVFGRFIEHQQTYNLKLCCSTCKRIKNKLGSSITFEKIDKNKAIYEFEYESCRNCCKKMDLMDLQFRSVPAWLYLDTVYGDNQLNNNLGHTMLPKKLKINNYTYQLLLAQIIIISDDINIANHFKGIFLINNNFYLIDDLQKGASNLKIPKNTKVTSCLYYLE